MTRQCLTFSRRLISICPRIHAKTGRCCLSPRVKVQCVNMHIIYILVDSRPIWTSHFNYFMRPVAHFNYFTCPMTLTAIFDAPSWVISFSDHGRKKFTKYVHWTWFLIKLSGMKYIPSGTQWVKILWNFLIGHRKNNEIHQSIIGKKLQKFSVTCRKKF